MTRYSGSSAATNVNSSYHSHRMPDGNYSPIHSHMNGNVPHDHIVIQDHYGKWQFDTLNDPILLADQQRIGVLLTGSGAPAKQNQPGAGIYTDPVAQQGINKICEEAEKEAEEPRRSRSDIIWELLKGAAKQ